MDNLYLFLLSYLLGSIPFALIIGKLFYKTDIRKHGSGNLGATNTFRTLGKKAGIIVMLGDIGKGTLAASLPLWFNSELSPLLIGLFAIIGHSYPIFAKFKGGKSVATSAGVFIAISPIIFCIGFLTFLLSLKISKYVSLSSTLSAVSMFISTFFFSDISLQIFTLCIAIFISVKHKSNFYRIKSGTEPKVKWL